MLIFFTWLCFPMFTCLYFADNMTITIGNCLKLIFTFSATNHLKSFFLQICWAAICKTCNIASSIRIIYVIQLLKVVLLKMCVCVCVCVCMWGGGGGGVGGGRTVLNFKYYCLNDFICIINFDPLSS